MNQTESATAPSDSALSSDSAQHPDILDVDERALCDMNSSDPGGRVERQEPRAGLQLVSSHAFPDRTVSFKQNVTEPEITR